MDCTHYIKKSIFQTARHAHLAQYVRCARSTAVSRQIAAQPTFVNSFQFSGILVALGRYRDDSRPKIGRLSSDLHSDAPPKRFSQTVRLPIDHWPILVRRPFRAEFVSLIGQFRRVQSSLCLEIGHIGR
ncbi:hypothetical protein DPMN_129759 [Dreissena polymorpha]|uniref:Uncharacterized protein n=1 Tax=Dreissena polymorpha TaxID=45954 RepID=A0A9D4H6C3_DREPO|nr:hypothetical protein DPMN_129759 [Dreissena polymorpha]